MSDKNFVGSGWKKTFANGGEIINISISAEKFKTLTPNASGYFKLTLAPLREPGKANQTHTLYEDTYGKENAPVAPAKPAEPETKLPF